MTTKTIHCLLGLLLLATHTLAQDVIRGRCVAVSDGDTIKVLATGRELLRIRVAWIDCPELGQAFGRCAMQLMRTLVFGKDVELRPHAIDRYGFSAVLVRRPFLRNLRHLQSYREFCLAISLCAVRRMG